MEVVGVGELVGGGTGLRTGMKALRKISTLGLRFVGERGVGRREESRRFGGDGGGRGVVCMGRGKCARVR